MFYTSKGINRWLWDTCNGFIDSVWIVVWLRYFLSYLQCFSVWRRAHQQPHMYLKRASLIVNPKPLIKSRMISLRLKFATIEDQQTRKHCVQWHSKSVACMVNGRVFRNEIFCIVLWLHRLWLRFCAWFLDFRKRMSVWLSCKFLIGPVNRKENSIR